MTMYTLRILKAVNGWTVMEGSQHGAEPRNVLVCEGDERLAETIAAALVAGKLDGDPPPQVIVKPQPIKPQPAHSNLAAAALATATQFDLDMAKRAAREMANSLKDA